MKIILVGVLMKFAAATCIGAGISSMCVWLVAQSTVVQSWGELITNVGLPTGLLLIMLGSVLWMGRRGVLFLERRGSEWVDKMIENLTDTQNRVNDIERRVDRLEAYMGNKE